jgi:hypothetical protein
VVLVHRRRVVAPLGEEVIAVKRLEQVGRARFAGDRARKRRRHARQVRGAQQEVARAGGRAGEDLVREVVEDRFRGNVARRALPRWLSR